MKNKNTVLLVGCALLLSLVGSVQSATITMDALIKQNPGKDYATIRAQVIDTYTNVVVYVGASWCKYCKITIQAIHALLKEFPDVLFIIIDSDKYPSLRRRGATIPELHFYKHGCSLGATGSQKTPVLRASLKKYYR